MSSAEDDERGSATLQNCVKDNNESVLWREEEYRSQASSSHSENSYASAVGSPVSESNSVGPEIVCSIVEEICCKKNVNSDKEFPHTHVLSSNQEDNHNCTACSCSFKENCKDSLMSPISSGKENLQLVVASSLDSSSILPNLFSVAEEPPKIHPINAMINCVNDANSNYSTDTIAVSHVVPVHELSNPHNNKEQELSSASLLPNMLECRSCSDVDLPNSTVVNKDNSENESPLKIQNLNSEGPIMDCKSERELVSIPAISEENSNLGSGKSSSEDLSKGNSDDSLVKLKLVRKRKLSKVSDDHQNSKKGKKLENSLENANQASQNEEAFMTTFTQNGKKMFKCKFCGKTAKTKGDMVKHIRVHTGYRPFECKICSKKFIQISGLRSHEKIHTGEKKYVCDICQKPFSVKERLKNHMRIHTGEKPYACKECGRTFNRRGILTEHMKRHGERRQFICSQCNAVYTTKIGLKSHMLTHSGEKKFKCPECGKRFLLRQCFLKHLDLMHKDQRRFICEICNKSFKGHLKQHMLLHYKIKPYKCDVCEATFTQSSQLKVHSRLHTGKRPYVCPICKSSFTHSSAWNIHMRKYTGEKPFNCQLCNSMFSQLPHLKKHMRCVHKKHLPYVCIACNEYFRVQSQLLAHQKDVHMKIKSSQDQDDETTLFRIRRHLAIVLHKISSKDHRDKLGFGKVLIDDVLKRSLKSSGYTPINDSSLNYLESLRQNIRILLQWTVPKKILDEYLWKKMEVDEIMEALAAAC